jgi:hypothetical protein
VSERTLAPLLLLLLASCRATRLYEGPELPPDQLVRLEETFSFWSSVDPDLLELDGKPVNHHMVSGDWELAPGPHAIVAQSLAPAPFIGPRLVGDRCTLQFTGEPGVTYELRSEMSHTHPPLSLSIVDTRTGAVVVDNEPGGAADCLSADVDWAGRVWVPSKYHTNASQSIVLLVPEGRTIKDTDEWAELQCHYGEEGPPDVDEFMGEVWQAWKDSADDPNMTVLAREEGASPSLVFTLYGTDDEDRLTSGLVLLRTAGNRVHVLMWFKVTPAFDEAELATWRERFAQARLYEPKVR